MSKFAHRTQRLEDALNLEEMISRWLRELQRFESPGDYLLKISGNLENLSPAHQFLDQARHSFKAPRALDRIRSAMKKFVNRCAG
jgi:hypothetical protein